MSTATNQLFNGNANHATVAKNYFASKASMLQLLNENEPKEGHYSFPLKAQELSVITCLPEWFFYLLEYSEMPIYKFLSKLEYSYCTKQIVGNALVASGLMNVTLHNEIDITEADRNKTLKIAIKLNKEGGLGLIQSYILSEWYDLAPNIGLLEKVGPGQWELFNIGLLVNL